MQTRQWRFCKRTGISAGGILAGMVDRDAEAQRDLVRQMMTHAGMDASTLARAAGVWPSTVTRFLNGDVKHLLSNRTLLALQRASGLPRGENAPHYLIDQLDQVSLLVLWDELTPAQRVAVLQYIRTLRIQSRSSGI